MTWLRRLLPERRYHKRVKTPTVLQMEAVECGAAALGIILGYYGRYVALEELREACGISRDGSKAGNMMRAAAGYGLTAKGFRVQAAALKDYPLPVIVFWEYNHFLVVEGFGRNKVYLNDPALGPRTVTWQEFEESFSGIVLTFAKGPQFQPGGRKHLLYRGLLRFLGGSRPAIIYGVLAGLALVIPGMLVPTFSKIFVDQYLVAGLKYWVRPLLLAMGLTALMMAGLTWLQRQCLLRQEIKMALSISGHFFWHVLRLPVEFFNQRFAGDVASRVEINDRLAELLSGELANNFLGLIAIFFFAILMAGYDVVLALVVIAVALVNLVALRYVSRRRRDLNLRMIQESGKLMGTSMDGLNMIETLKASGAESTFFSRWAGYQAKVIEAQQQFGTYSYYLNAVPPLLTALNNAAVIGLGGLLVMKGRISMGMLVAFQSFMMAFITPLNKLVGLGGELQEIDGDMRRVDDVLRYQEIPQFRAAPPPQAPSPPKLTGQLELRNITFGYSNLAPPFIRDFNLKLGPGFRVALVGPSGSGKSTIARLICGLYEPWEGEVLLDGWPRQDFSRVLLSQSLSMVDQSILLFEGTVRENLTLFDHNIAEPALIQAGKDACIHEELMARAGGYDCQVVEGGANFSGGQRQRLEIARALVNDPTILVLDEATSALDPVTEVLIDDNLRRRGCTCIIVAHRLSTIRDCDEIIVLDRGQVVQRGRHEQLINQEGLYAELIHTE
ncbi:MAG: NHLP family bacteriocin export ABC transporter peptidase/permease/ATPase subunit [Syntrophales bacterium]|nr:NHLP family bacteriocin export ABC transporter peptidase/permease/ATPase subunit [Syntrophales bacterium]MDD5640193.1 NHLP family bacteriocin export ABC transporter peptidase/permease/ATPase subunit [Syntrophales bacterium]